MPQQRVNQLTPRRKKSDGGVLAQSSSSAAATTKQQSSHNKNLQQNANDEEPTRMIDTKNTSDKEMKTNDNMSTNSSSATEEEDDNSSSDSDSDDDSQDSKQQPPNSNATSNTNSKSSQLTQSERDELSKTLTLPPNINHINELSDYEILRLRNIQRNEAKLASLGLFAGITSKNGGVGTNNKGKKKNVTPKSAAAIKAANTRRRNAANAKLMIENHEKWQRSQQQISMELNGGGTSNTTAIYASFKGSSNSYYRSQPSRTAKSKSISYTSSTTQSTPKRIQQWHTNLSLLKAYHSQHQSYNISRTSQNGKYKPLADWLNRQRIQYNKYKSNEKHTLDNERVSLLEGLNGVWWKRTRANSSSNGGRVRSRKREVSFGKSRGKDINIARQLWNERNQDMSTSSSTDDNSSILDRMEREVYSDSESEYGRLSPKKEEVGSDSYYYDSYSDEYESDDYSRRDDGMATARRGREYESEEDSRVEDYYSQKLPSIKKKRSNSFTNNTSSRRMSSLEQVAPPEKVSHHTRSPKRRRKSSKRRKKSNEDYYDQYDDRRRRSYSPQHQSRHHEMDRRQHSSSRRRPFHHDERSLMSEEGITSREEEDTNSGSSLMIEEEHYIRRSSQKRKRVRRRSNDDDYDYHHHRPHRGGGSELVRQQKPMNEIIISPSNTGTTAVAQSTTTTVTTLERNKLLAEYGKLYERQCYIYERKTRLELELRAIHSMLLENNRKSKSEMSSADIGIGMIGNGGMSIGNRLVGNLGSANKLLTIGDK